MVDKDLKKTFEDIENRDYSKQDDKREEENYNKKIAEYKNQNSYECISCGSVLKLIKPNKPRGKCSCGYQPQNPSKTWEWKQYYKLIKKQAEFFYYAKKPEKEVITLKQVEDVIKKNSLLFGLKQKRVYLRVQL